MLRLDHGAARVLLSVHVSIVMLDLGAAEAEIGEGQRVRRRVVSSHRVATVQCRG